MTQATSIPMYPATDMGGETAPSGLWRDAWQRLSRGRANLICVIIVALYVLVGLLGFLPAMEAKITDIVGGSFDPPKFVLNHPAVWFGTDIMGHSVFWQ